MAKFEVKISKELERKLNNLDIKLESEIIPKMLDEGGRITEGHVRSALASSIGKGKTNKSTGELKRSLGVSPVKQDSEGNYNVKVGFSEPRSDGTSNEMVASVLEYGKHGQPARPFMDLAKKKAKTEVEKAMERIFENEVAKIK